MHKFMKLAVALAATVVYGLILRYVAPSREPYYLLGLGLIGYVTWLFGTLAGLGVAIGLVPLTANIYNQFNFATSYVSVASSPPFIGIELLAVITIGRIRQRMLQLEEQDLTRIQANDRLQTTLSEVQELGGIHSICATCHNIMDENNEWVKVDTFLAKTTKMEFSHAICPDCIADYQN